MDISEYFLTLEYVLIASTFVALVLIFLYSYFGKEEEPTTERG
jgi:ABC-type multidrug transport system permease subunit